MKIRPTLYLPDQTVEEIDRQAAAAGISRAQYVATAASAQVGREAAHRDFGQSISELREAAEIADEREAALEHRLGMRPRRRPKFRRPPDSSAPA